MTSTRPKDHLRLDLLFKIKAPELPPRNPNLIRNQVKRPKTPALRSPPTGVSIRQPSVELSDLQLKASYFFNKKKRQLEELSWRKVMWFHHKRAVKPS
ncbi:Hypothetical protein SMAX5B_006562 [Scophthalmus maximus]|uniref:Uncharacterized protein n=1 Tax=Scophthalmus maximus TaxID=52904 RepID=A0A2U9CPX6_SCOMX|nr:Hypothetical protein SMAX5B_006562 [Scophthalmus maximus]